MFKDPFSPDHTQKLEDEWLRYFKKNCKNPKMVSGTFSVHLCLNLIGVLLQLHLCQPLPGEEGELGKAGDPPSGGELSLYEFCFWYNQWSTVEFSF